MNMELNTTRWTLHLGGAAGCIAIIVACYAVGYSRVSASELQWKQSRQIAEQFLQSRSQIEERCGRAQAEVRQLESELNGLAKRVPDRSLEDELLRRLSRLADESKIRLLDFQPSGFKDVGEYRASVVRLNLRGNYNGLCLFLSQLKKSPRVLRMGSMSVRMSDRNSGRMEATMEIHALFNTTEADRT